MGEGKITREMIESYIDTYNRAYGDDIDAYVEEIIADAYAGMNRTEYGTNRLRADVKVEAGQWQKKTGSARAPPAKMSASMNQIAKKYQGVNLAEDGSIYTYDFLAALPDMDVTMLPEVDAVRGADNRVDTAKVVQEGMKNARAVGTERDGKIFVKNQYTGKLLRIDTSSVRHGLYGEANRILTNARLGAVIGDIVKNAVPVNALKNEAKNVIGTYAMAAYAEDNAGRQFSAIVTVEQRTGAVAEVEVYDVTHAVSGRQKRSERAGTKPQGVYPSTNASSKITIADFLKIVNRVHQSVLSQDVMDHFGEMKDPGGYYTNRVKFSASADQTSTEQRKQNDKAALGYFGRTYKWSETGYVLLNGARLDFSGRHEGGPGGYRTVDHRDIIDALGEDYGGGDYSGGMVRFMQEGNIRISPESGGINLAVMPTKAQMDALGDFISKERGEVILDIDDAQGNTISSTEFSRGTHANKVLQAIRDYFENGTLPQADNTPSVSQFRYSAQDGSYRDLMGEKPAQYVRGLERRLVNELAENLSVPGQAKQHMRRYTYSKTGASPIREAPCFTAAQQFQSHH